jgi:hypothetical protein
MIDRFCFTGGLEHDFEQQQKGNVNWRIYVFGDHGKPKSVHVNYSLWSEITVGDLVQTLY